MDDITAAYARELQTAISGIEIRYPFRGRDGSARTPVLPSP